MIKNLAKYAIKLKFMRENNMPDPVKALQPILPTFWDIKKDVGRKWFKSLAILVKKRHHRSLTRFYIRFC